MPAAADPFIAPPDARAAAHRADGANPAAVVAWFGAVQAQDTRARNGP